MVPVTWRSRYAAERSQSYRNCWMDFPLVEFGNGRVALPLRGPNRSGCHVPRLRGHVLISPTGVTLPKRPYPRKSGHPPNAGWRREDTLRNTQVFFPPPSRTHPPPIFLPSPSPPAPLKEKDKTAADRARGTRLRSGVMGSSSAGGVRERKESGGGGARGGGGEKLGVRMVLATALSDFVEG
jgi:hypothetical protein